MNELKLYFNELYSKNIEKSDYEPLLQHLNQFNHALVTVLQEERMIVYDIINILMKLQFIYEMKEWYEFCLAIENSIVCFKSFICFEEMDDLSCYDFAYYHYKLGNYQEAYSYAKTCYEMRKKQNNDQEIEDIINILLDSLDKLDDGSLSYLKERYEQY